MYRDKYWASHIPLWMALLFLLNVFLIGAVELLAVYRYPAAADEAALARWDEACEGCTILSRDERPGLTCLLVQTEEGYPQLVVVKPHSVLARRARYVSVPLSDGHGPEDLNIRLGLHTATVHRENTRVQIEFYSPTTLKTLIVLYTVAAALLEAAEIGLWYLLKGRFTRP